MRRKRRIKRRADIKLHIFMWIILAFTAFSAVNNSEADYRIKAPVSEKKPEIFFSSNEVQPGGFFTIYISNVGESDRIKTSTALVQEAPFFYRHASGRLSIAAVNCRVKAGIYRYKVSVLRSGETAAEKEIALKVLPREFGAEYLKVSESQKKTRSGENLDADQKLTGEAKSGGSAEPLWTGGFIRPVEGKLTTEFGMVRYINGTESGRHSGVDLKAPEGTPVKASNGGFVRLAMPLKVTGNTVIIDHGLGIYTSYCHLDKLEVSEGQRIARGDTVGGVGSTGFSTGPHLHWTVTIGSIYVDPMLLEGVDPIEPIKTGQL